MPPPPEEPTRPLRPVQPGYEREQVAERVVEPDFDPRFALASLEDRVRSLQTMMWVVGLVSLAALAIGIYALIQAAEDDTTTTRTGSGVSQSEVSSLEDRVDELEGREAADPDSVEKAIEDKADAADVAALEKAIGELQQQGEQPAEAEQDPATAQAITDLTQRLDDLERRVQEAEAQRP